jgi:hypothetical protein
MMRKFQQPELTGPSGEPVAVPDDLAKRILGFARDDRDSPEFMRNADPRLMTAIFEHAKALVGERLENAVLLASDGRCIRKTVGTERAVSVPSDLLERSNLVHNHPAGTPLGTEDVENAIRHGMQSVWALGGDWLYGAAATDRPISIADLRLRSDYLDRAIYAVLVDALKHGSLPESRLESAHLHALWSELAREDLIRYGRFRHGW